MVLVSETNDVMPAIRRQSPLARQLRLLAAAGTGPNINLCATACGANVFVTKIFSRVGVPHNLTLVVLPADTGEGQRVIVGAAPLGSIATATIKCYCIAAAVVVWVYYPDEHLLEVKEKAILSILVGRRDARTYHRKRYAGHWRLS